MERFNSERIIRNWKKKNMNQNDAVGVIFTSLSSIQKKNTGETTSMQNLALLQIWSIPELNDAQNSLNSLHKRTTSQTCPRGYQKGLLWPKPGGVLSRANLQNHPSHPAGHLHQMLVVKGEEESSTGAICPCLCSLLPSGQRYLCLKTTTERFKWSF